MRRRVVRVGSAVRLFVVIGLVSFGPIDRALAFATEDTAPVDFARDVAPILERRCYECHGPKRRKAELRLDARADTFERRLVVPGDPDSSPLWQRLVMDDPFERMPAEGAPLAAAELEAIRRWIEAGARWPDVDADVAGGTGEIRHWAYEPVVRPDVPAVPGVRHPIDAFVARGLAAHGRTLSREADRAVLLRRVSLDLVGLPPSPSDVAAFEADPAPDAYERAVDRLLASPHYGEHQARSWLDLARYADTDGYEKDERRTMWRWRDWVVDAFNDDMPFDRFTIAQIAGDLLPDATAADLLATGFHRNTMLNKEGGVDAEEFRVAAVVDRVDTTAEVWLGSTIACARCHDHKFDPFSQREYFELYAFYDQTEDDGTADGPEVDAPTPEQVRRIAEIEPQVERLEALLAGWSPELERDLAELVERVRRTRPDWTVARPTSTRADDGSRLAVLDDGSVLAFGDPPSADTYRLRLPVPAGRHAHLRLEILTDPSLGGGVGPGRPGHGNFVLNELVLKHAGAPVALGAARADHEQPGYPAAAAADGDPATGWAIAGGIGVDHELLVDLAEPLELAAPAELELEVAQLYGTHHVIGRLRVALTASVDAAYEPLAPHVTAWIDAQPGDEAAREALRSWYRERAPRLEPDHDRLAALRAELVVPTSLVLREREEPRETCVQVRGNFLARGDVVAPAVPAVLPPLPSDAPRNRLGLARWLVDPQHPLTARVTVNRIWDRLFGRGLVATSNDFGTRGDAPSHPELLDWLASELVAQGWSLKALQRAIVVSATYRQSSRVDPELLDLDPDNVRLGRGPRFRMDAEVVRDVALTASGALDRTIGGPSVFPPQPEGTWAMTYSADRWTTSSDGDRFRRGLYTFWRRTSPYPTFQIFDAPTREACCSRRPRTSSPLQALALLGDPAFVELARRFARRILSEGGAGDDERIEWAFRACVARAPSAEERAIVARLLAVERAGYAANPEAAGELVAAVSDPHAEDEAGAVELAPWIVVANTLLNLDETITKG